MDLPAGGVLGVVGPNGAGKTTLFSLLLGFLRPSAGTVEVDGLPPRRYARERGFAYLPERFDLPHGWPVRRALLALARLDGHGKAGAVAAADAALERFALDDVADRRLGELSRGMLQRVGLAQASLSRGRVVVLDEPTQGLDPLWRIRLRGWIAELRSDGRTVLLASHELDEVERLADRVLLLRDGAVRELVEAPRSEAGRVYRLEVRADESLLRAAFPDAAPIGGGGGGDGGGDDDGGAWRVTASDDADLSRRLAALIDGGGVVGAVVPAEQRLEERVRRSLEEPR